MSEFVCPNATILCKLHDCEKCQFSGDMSRCPHAHSTGPEDLCPTFEWAVKNVLGCRDICLAHRRTVANYVRSDIRLVGLDETCKLSAMTRGKFKILITLLEARGLSHVTVRGHLDAFSSLCSERHEESYASAGYEMPAFAIPAYSSAPVAKQEVPERSVAKFRKMMGHWVAEGNTQLYIAAWFGLNAGMRWGDICRIKWDVFVHTIDGVFIAYTPHKTEKSSGARVSFRVDAEAYLDIEPYVGKADSYVIVRHSDHGLVAKHGEYANMHRSLHDRINAALRECGIGTENNGKRFHALRKRFDTRNAQRYGETVAASMAGHSVEIARKHYIGTESGRWA